MLVGMSEAKEHLRKLSQKIEFVRLGGSPKVLDTCMNIVLTGNPGVGKTTFARLLFRFLKAHGVLKKDRRKIEGELKICQETVAELERSKKELEAAIMRKENEIHGFASKLDDEQNLVGKTQKAIKELQGRIEEMEEELEAERRARAKAERQRSDLARELESLGERLNEATGTTHAQIE